MLHFEPVDKRVVVQPDMDLEDLDVALLPPGQRTAREHLCVGEPCLAVQQDGQGVYDVEYRGFRDAIWPEQQGHLLERQLEVDQALVVVDVELL